METRLEGRYTSRGIQDLLFFSFLTLVPYNSEQFCGINSLDFGALPGSEEENGTRASGNTPGLELTLHKIMSENRDKPISKYLHN